MNEQERDRERDARDDPEEASNAGRGRRQRRNRGSRNGPQRENKFKGKCEELAGHVYDTGHPHGNQDLFINTTKEIAEYVAREYTHAGEFRLGMMNLELPPLTPPTPPQDANPGLAAVEMYKLDLKEHHQKSRNREANMEKVYALVLGQCSRTIRDRLEASANWGDINDGSDVMRLLTLIRDCIYSRATTRNPTHSLVDAQAALYTFRQKDNMSNHDFLQKFKGLVEVVEHLGGTLGVDEGRVSEFLNDPDNANANEIVEATARARDDYLACLFITKSDPKRYGNLIADLENDYTRGIGARGDGGYPDTLSKAYDMIVNYRTMRVSHRQSEQENGIAFYVEHGTDQGRGRGCGNGRGGRGRGIPGRGDGRGNGNRASREELVDEQAHVIENNQNNVDIEGYPVFVHDTTRAEHMLLKHRQQGRKLPNNWLLGDTCSTANIISDLSLLTNIRKAPHAIAVHCNAGTVLLDSWGDFGTFPKPVWYNPKGIANIMSLYEVSKHYRIEWDTDRGNHITVHTGPNPIVFHPSEKGLYHHVLSDSGTTDIWTFFQTTKQQAEAYSKRQVERARAARKVQNILMFPSTREYMDKGIKQLRICTITRGDILAAEDIYGPNLGSLKGKTVRRNPSGQHGVIDPVPEQIMRLHNNIHLAGDIFFINNLAFLLTMSRGVRFLTVEFLGSRQIDQIRKSLKSVMQVYHHRGFKITSLHADHEFEPLRPYFPMLTTTGADDHVPDIERMIRTLKGRARSAYRLLPFKHVPRIIVIHLVKNTVMWMNSFTADNGCSQEYSPRYIMTGKQLDFGKHARLEFGEYVQTHEKHDNSMQERTTGAICLGPTGNDQGTHWFMSLTTGLKIARTRWTALPMPQDVIERVNEMGRKQGMPPTLTFGDRHGKEIEDHLDELSDDEDSTYNPASDNGSTEDDSSWGGDDDDSLPWAMDPPPNDIDEMDDNQPQHHEIDDHDGLEEEFPDNVPEEDQNDDGHSVGVVSSDDQESAPAGQDDDYMSSRHSEYNDEQAEIPGVDGGNTGVEDASDEDSDESPNPTMDEAFSDAEAAGRAAAHDGTTLPKRDRRPAPRDDDFVYENFTLMDLNPDVAFSLMMEEDIEDMWSYLTAQMNAKTGLKHFGEAGAEAIMKELEQLLYRKVMRGRKANTLTKEEKKSALTYLMFLKEKRCGKIKGRGCADGRKQRLYKSKEETSSPTVSLESLFLSCLIDAKEGRDVATVDIPGAFMQAEIDEVLFLKLEGDLARLLIRLDPSYQAYLTYEGGKPVIYTQLSKALYGTLQAALLFWKNLTEFLLEHGFKPNPYDSCVMNKMIEGEQCTVAWHVDDLKISHKKGRVVTKLIDSISERYGKEAPLTITRGPVHEYLGMTIDFSKPGEVQFTMMEYIEQVLEETPESLMKGSAATPAASHLFTVGDDREKLSSEDAEIYHHLVAKVLYLCKRTRPDLQTAVSFLTTRVQSPDIDDWKKLGRCLKYLSDTKDLPLRLKATDGKIKWWIDASFAVHKDCRSHTGATMSMGAGCPVSMSTKQKINTRSSTEAELVGVNDAMALILWTRNFLLAQGYTVEDNIIFQDNKSAILLEENGRRSSGKKTRHIEIRYFFITDNIKRGTAKVVYCPTEQMVADFFTKPLQGALFRKFRRIIMGEDLAPNDQGEVATQTKETIFTKAVELEQGAQECVESSVGESRVESGCPKIQSHRAYSEVVKGVRW